MATQTGMSECCLSGHLHTGTPKGREETIGGLATYVAEPKDGSKSKTVVFVVDIFGYALPNVRLLADQYAAAGFYCYVPDLHAGDSIDISHLSSIVPSLKDQQDATFMEKVKNSTVMAVTLGPWLVRHREGVTKPIVDGFVDHVRGVAGTGKIGAIGFCWGGRYAILTGRGPNASEKGGVDAVYACHPSFLAIPTDLEQLSVPLSIAIGDKDAILDTKGIEQIREYLQKDKPNVPSEVRVYDDQVHGFTLRGDWSSDKDKTAMDDALKQGVEFFHKYL